MDKYKCYVCHVEFTNNKKCLDHLYKNHKFTCKMCHFQFKNVKALTKHCEQEHPKRKCKKCNVFFLSDEGLSKAYIKVPSVVSTNHVCILADITIFHFIVEY